MSTDSHRELIASLPLFNAFPDPLTQRIAAVFEEVSEFQQVARDTQLIGAEQQAPTDGYILLQGSVKIAKRIAPSFTATAPVLLGEVMPSDEDDHETADVTALEDLEVLHFDWGRFNDLLKERLAPSEFAIFGRVLQDYSWLQFLGQES